MPKNPARPAARNTIIQRPAVLKLSSVEPTKVRWLWQDRLALGKLTLLAGDPGLGKSYLTLDLAARVSAGLPFPSPAPGSFYSTPGSTPGTSAALHTDAESPTGAKRLVAGSSSESPTPNRPTWVNPPASVIANSGGGSGGGSGGSGGGLQVDPPLSKGGGRKVILLSAEDDPADTIRPRLDAAGADCDNIELLQAIRTGDQHRPVNLRQDINHLEHVVRSHEGRCRLIVIDPISAYLGDDEGHSNTKVRNMLAPLSDLAQQYNVAILAVTHLNKGSGAGGSGGASNAVYRTMGSLAFTAAARAVHLVARDPADAPARGGTGTRRLMVPIKNNLGGDQTGWGFRLTTHEFPDPLGGDPDDYPDGLRRETRVVWDDHPTQEQADALLQKLGHPTPAPGSGVASPALSEAVTFLHDVLAKGGRPISELVQEAEALGISKATLKRARYEAGVSVNREGGRHGRWVWSLDEPLEAKESNAGDGLLYGPPPSS